MTEVKQMPTPLPFLQQKMAHDLSKHLDANIELKCNKKGKGKLIISFHNSKDFERIINTINT